MNLNTMTVTELKAAAYDLMARITEDQRNIGIINQAITSKLAQATVPVEEPTEE